jgi:hypothetical protein
MADGEQRAVTYYLRELGLQKTAREYMQFESYRRRQRIAQRTRRAKKREAKLRVLRTRRAELYARESDLPRRKCQLCRETWPLTEEFFRHAGIGRNYCLNTCRMCDHSLTGTAEERRKQRMLAHDRNVVIKQITVARVERDSFLHQHPNFRTRRCSRCHELWELLPKRFPTYKGSAASCTGGPADSVSEQVKDSRNGRKRALYRPLGVACKEALQE